jgi:phytoene synthase
MLYDWHLAYDAQCMTVITGDLAACMAIVERGDPDRFLALMAMPLAARAQLAPLFAMNVEVARAPWASSEAMICEMRLQWWRDVLEEIAGGDAVRRHEVATPLATVLPAQQAQALDGLVAARRWDIYRDAFEDEAALKTYLGQTGGILMSAAVAVLGGKPDAAAHHFGTALAVAGFLQAIPELESRGRIPMVDGRPAAVRSLAQWGLDQIAQARREGIGKKGRVAVLTAWQAKPLLQMAQRHPEHVTNGILHLSEVARRWRLLAAGITRRV